MLAVSICKNCKRDHKKCLICNSDHLSKDCPSRCEGINISRPIINRRINHDCVKWSGNVNHICNACSRIWQITNIETKNKPSRYRCWCLGNHYYYEHTVDNCRYCIPIRVSYLTHGTNTPIVCTHKYRTAATNESRFHQARTWPPHME
jgi:hypothetical protein